MLCVDLYCGLGGWAEGFLAEGFDVIGFDIERHDYGTGGYPGQLVIQDVLTLHGSQFRNATCIVASPPCQRYSYMAMPWSRAKELARGYRENIGDLNALFNACFRIQREAIEATGKDCPACYGEGPRHSSKPCARCGGTCWITRYIPMVVENVKGAQPWVGPAKAHYGSYYFWGDVESVNGAVVAGPLQFGSLLRAKRRGAEKVGRNFHQFENTGIPSASFHGAPHEMNVQRAEAIKNGRKGTGGSICSYHGQNGGGDSWQGIKQNGSGPEWFNNGIAKHSSRSDSRKAASAQIAKIPFPLANYIARSFKPPQH